ncbi:MAG: hypothetical protein ACK5JU_11635 [Bacteroidales bacterium]
MAYYCETPLCCSDGKGLSPSEQTDDIRVSHFMNMRITIVCDKHMNQWIKTLYMLATHYQIIELIIV